VSAAGKLVYLDNAATTAVHQGTVTAMLPFLTAVYGNPSSPHEAGRRARYAVDEARERVAEALGCAPREVVFTSGGSESVVQAIRTAVAWGRTRGRARVVASAVEHHAVLRTLAALEAEGVTYDLVAPGADGTVDPEAAEALMGDDVCLVSVMAANNETGCVQPIERIAQVAHRFGALFHTDAVQAVGHLPFSLEACGADLASLSAHKFHGPKGAGALLCRSEALGAPLAAAPVVYGGAQEDGRRAGTENVAGIVGLACALAEATGELERYRSYVGELRDELEGALVQMGGCHVVGGASERVAGISCVCFEGVDRQGLVAALDRQGVCASGGAACASGAVRASHVLAAMGVDPELARGQLRLSLSLDTSRTDVLAAAGVVEETVARLRREAEGRS
jgi:cysteine desulfurase